MRIFLTNASKVSLTTRISLVALLLTAATVGIFLLSQSIYADPPRHVSYSIEPPDSSALEVVVFRPVTVPLKVTNDGNTKIRVIGGEGGCLKASCSRVNESFKPFVVEPGATKEMLIDIKVAYAEPFEIPFGIFIDSGKLESVRVVITGTGKSDDKATE